MSKKWESMMKNVTFGFIPDDLSKNKKNHPKCQDLIC